MINGIICDPWWRSAQWLNQNETPRYGTLEGCGDSLGVCSWSHLSQHSESWWNDHSRAIMLRNWVAVSKLVTHGPSISQLNGFSLLAWQRSSTCRITFIIFTRPLSNRLLHGEKSSTNKQMKSTLKDFVSSRTSDIKVTELNNLSPSQRKGWNNAWVGLGDDFRFRCDRSYEYGQLKCRASTNLLC